MLIQLATLLNQIVNAKRAVTTDTALRLAQVTGMSADPEPLPRAG